MKRIGIALALTTTLLLVSPGMASAANWEREDPNVGLMIVDAVFVRPISAVAGIAATGFYVALAPITWTVGWVSDPCWGKGMWDDMVVGSWNFTVRRPLGDFSD
jgi:hypothetical protein